MKIWKHLKRILIHKYWVFYYSCKFGIPWQGIKHDLSKFSLVEFKESIKFYNEKESPINEAKRVQGYSLAWQHHKGRNPHHYEYWVDNVDKGGIAIKMPFKYVIELICDYLAAGKTYNGKNFSFKDELDWWKNRQRNILMHEDTKYFITYVLELLCSASNLNIKELEGIYYHLDKIRG